MNINMAVPLYINHYCRAFGAAIQIVYSGLLRHCVPRKDGVSSRAVALYITPLFVIASRRRGNPDCFFRIASSLRSSQRQVELL
jgi:hypothetical protein